MLKIPTFQRLYNLVVYIITPKARDIPSTQGLTQYMSPCRGVVVFIAHPSEHPGPEAHQIVASSRGWADLQFLNQKEWFFYYLKANTKV